MEKELSSVAYVLPTCGVRLNEKLHRVLGNVFVTGFFNFQRNAALLLCDSKSLFRTS